MVAVVVISLTLLGISGWLIDSHRRTWLEAQASTTLSRADKQFAGAMFRRRMHSSGTIGATGAAIALWPVIPQRPLAMAVYLALLLAACSWIMLLALADFAATRKYYRRLRKEQRAKQVELAMELAALRDGSESDGQTT